MDDPGDLRDVEAGPLVDRPGSVRRFVGRMAIDVRPLRESPQFRRLWVGQSISLIGSQISFVAIPYQVYELTHSTFFVGLIALCQLIPLLTLAVVGGAIADAVDRRRLILVTEIGLVVVTVFLAVNASLAEPKVWPLFFVATAATALWALGSPAMRSLTPHLVPEDQFAAASALNGVYSNMAAVAGPAVGGHPDRHHRADGDLPDRRRNVRRVARLDPHAEAGAPGSGR